MKTVIATGFAEGQRRDPMHQADWVVLVDGDLAQIADIEQAARALGVSVVIIVDIMHVLEYSGRQPAWLPRRPPKWPSGSGTNLATPARGGQVNRAQLTSWVQRPRHERATARAD